MGTMHELARDSRRARWWHVVALLVLGCAGAASYAQAWKPEKNVEIIVPTGAGGGQDRTARAIHRILQETRMVEPSVTVVNKPGGGGAIAYGYLNEHTGNGHYVATSAPTLLTSYITGQSPYGPGDFTPLALLFNEYIGFIVRADSLIKSAMDLAERVRKDPAALTFALASAAANPNHIAIAQAMRAAGVEVKKLKIVVFNAAPVAMSALLGGHVDLVAVTAAQVVPLMKAGKVRIIAVSSPRRMAGALSSIPTWREQGIESVLTNWRIVVGPRGLSERQVAYWDAIFARLAATQEWKNELERNGFENSYTDSRDTRKYWDAQYEELRTVLNDLGLAK